MDFCTGFCYALVAIFLIAVVAYIYIKATRKACVSNVDLSGKTVIITGANVGIGYFTALDLATRNARVILACRNQERAETARDKIIKDTGNTNVIFKLLDLSSMKSVRTFAADIIKEEPRLDILINNAGVSGIAEKTIVEGLEYQYATNYFGPFLLTNLLLDLLKKTPLSRIVNVSSLVHQFGVIDFDNLCAERFYNTGKIYYNSKLALLVFTKELSKRLGGSGVTANGLHPGTVKTELFRYWPLVTRIGVALLADLYFMSGEEGAQTTLHCAIAEEVEGVSGKYFSDCRIIAPAHRADDEAVGKKLWEVSERLTGLYASST